MGKSTRLERQQRVNECVEKIVKDHMNYSMFLEWFMETYNMSKHNGYKYWVSCWNLIKSRFILEQDQLINKHLYSLYDLFKQAVDVGDFSTARHLLNDIAKFQGIDVPDKLNIKHEGEIKVSFGDEE